MFLHNVHSAYEIFSQNQLKYENIHTLIHMKTYNFIKIDQNLRKLDKKVNKCKQNWINIMHNFKKIYKNNQ